MMQDRLLRLPDVLNRIPVSKSAFWQGIKTGRYPKPLKLGPRTTVWLEADIQGLIDKIKAEVS